MAQIVMPITQIDKIDRLQVNVHIQAEVLSAEIARRRANVWLLENTGNLLRAETPELVLGDRLLWRVNIALTSPARGWIGYVGRLELDATSGDVLANETLAQEILPLAEALTAN